VSGLEVIGQTIIGSIKIKSLILDAGAKVPFPSDEEAMSVAEIVIKRVAVSKFAVVIVEIAVRRVVHLVIKKITVVFVRWRRRRLSLVRRRSGNDGRCGTEKQADKKPSYVFHELRRLGKISDEQANPDVSGRKYSGKVIIPGNRKPLRCTQQPTRSRSRVEPASGDPRLRFQVVISNWKTFSV
jgi:hypothetical protein